MGLPRYLIQFSSVQSLSLSDSLRPHESQHARPPYHHQLPEFTQTHVHRVDDAIQPSHPLSSHFPPAPNPSQHQSLYQWVNFSHKDWSFIFSILPSKEHPGLISFRIDWLRSSNWGNCIEIMHFPSSPECVLLKVWKPIWPLSRKSKEFEENGNKDLEWVKELLRLPISDNSVDSSVS